MSVSRPISSLDALLGGDDNKCREISLLEPRLSQSIQQNRDSLIDGFRASLVALKSGIHDWVEAGKVRWRYTIWRLPETHNEIVWHRGERRLKKNVMSMQWRQEELGFDFSDPLANLTTTREAVERVVGPVLRYMCNVATAHSAEVAVLLLTAVTKAQLEMSQRITPNDVPFLCPPFNTN